MHCYKFSSFQIISHSAQTCRHDNKTNRKHLQSVDCDSKRKGIHKTDTYLKQKPDHYSSRTGKEMIMRIYEHMNKVAYELKKQKIEHITV